MLTDEQRRESRAGARPPALDGAVVPVVDDADVATRSAEPPRAGRYPASARRFVANIFSEANYRLGEKIARIPDCPKHSLDLSLLEHLSQYGSPQIVAPCWAVQVSVDQYEGFRLDGESTLADIGILLVTRRQRRVVSRKLALLQSARLLAHKVDGAEEAYRIDGDPRLRAPSIAAPRGFAFAEQSIYSSFVRGDERLAAARDFEERSGLPVHHLLYNTWEVPAYYHLPTGSLPMIRGRRNGGATIISATRLRNLVDTRSTGYALSFDDVSAALSAVADDDYAWRLESFISNGLMSQQRELKASDDEQVSRLLDRRNSLLTAVVTITLEQFA